MCLHMRSYVYFYVCREVRCGFTRSHGLYILKEKIQTVLLIILINRVRRKWLKKSFSQAYDRNPLPLN